MTTLFLSIGILEMLLILFILLLPVFALVDILKSKFTGYNKSFVEAKNKTSDSGGKLGG